MMEQEQNIPEAEPLPDDKPSVGQRLREARERQGLSVDDVVAKIKLAPRQIIALEADDFQALPETAFVRGFVRSYARLLQLDAQSLLEALPGAPAPRVDVEPVSVEAPFPSERTARRQNLNLLIAALLITVLIAAFALWQANAPVHAPEPAKPAAPSEDALVATPLPLPEQVEVLDGSGVPEVPPASSVPVAEPLKPASAVAPAPVAPAGAGKMSALRLTFDKEAWVEIKDRDGKSLFNHLNRAGSELRVEGLAPFSLVVGHADSVHLYYRDKPIDMTPYTNASSAVARLTVE